MPDEKPFSETLKEVGLMGLSYGAQLTELPMRYLFAANLGYFVIEGMAGNTEEMNNAGMMLYFSGLGALAYHWAVHSHSSPINKNREWHI